MSYEQLFERNLGIFSPEEQERLRNGRVVMGGCGGIGGTMAMILARSGVGHFVLLDPQDYEPTNMNRQIACYGDTCGTNKAACLRDEIARINAEAEVTVDESGLQLEKLDELLNLADVFVPVMDAWPLSLTVLEMARWHKPSIMAYPVGALGRTCVFTAQSPTVAECLAMPYGYGYEQLQDYTKRPAARALLQYYRTEGAWTKDWFDGWVQGKLPHSQICAVVWVTASLAALEVVKLLTGKWKPVIAPRYWNVTPNGANIRRFGLGRRLVARLSRRGWVQRLYPKVTGSERMLQWFTRALG